MSAADEPEDEGPVPWDEIGGQRSRRQEILETAEEQFEDEEFSKNDINEHLNPGTTPGTLGTIEEEDGYLRQTQVGGGLFLRYDNPTLDEDEADFQIITESIDADEIRAFLRDIIDRHDVDIDLSEYDVFDTSDMNDVCFEVNQAEGRSDLLQIVGASHKWQLVDEARDIIQAHRNGD